MKPRYKKKKKKSNGVMNVKQHHRFRGNGDYKDIGSEWDENVKKAERGEVDEMMRAEIALKDSSLKCLQTCVESLPPNLDRFNTNMGFVLEREVSVAGTIVVYGTGDNGANEFIPIVIRVALGPLQGMDEHIDFLSSGAWQKMVKPIVPEEAQAPMTVKGEKTVFIE